MRVSLLGTGGPRPDPERQGPSTLVEVDGLCLLFDAGRGVATQLARIDVAPDELDAIFITHHHFDHVGGLGDLLMAAWNHGRDEPLAVYGPRGTGAIVSAIFEQVYVADIRFRIREAEVNGHTIRSIADIVTAHDVESGYVQPDPGVRVVVGRVEHGESALGLGDDEWTAVGYRVEAEEKAVTITGDAVAGRDLAQLVDATDVLVACCYLASDEIDSDETRFLSEHVLAGGPQVAAIAADAGCNHLVLTHLRQKSQPMLEALIAEIRQIYAGQITVGQDLLSLDV
ncbi:MAG: MBL fold metallo-hydrolase [bacterium]|nr:MBL fold metallo-hydrolase [bacterium]